MGLDSKKSNLNGSIPANVLRNTCDTFLPYYAEKINDSFQTGNFPNESNLGEEAPVCKKKRFS